MSVSLYANLMFVVVELVMAIVTGSQAVLLDGVYDGIEFVMLLPSIFLIPLLYKPSNEKYPFGLCDGDCVYRCKRNNNDHCYSRFDHRTVSIYYFHGGADS